MELDFQNHKHTSTKYKPFKKRLSENQVKRLELSFSTNNRLELQRKLELARELAIPPRQIAIWYQNKRARCKTQCLELDCGALRLRLEAALAENMRLEREVERLQGELHMFFMANMNLPHNHDRDFGYNNYGSSSSEQDVSLNTNSWVDSNDKLEFEELYDCLVGQSNHVS